MRYDWTGQIHSPEFFSEIDARFALSEALIRFRASLGDMEVLEMGVGNGTRAHLSPTPALTWRGAGE